MIQKKRIVSIVMALLLGVGFCGAAEMQGQVNTSVTIRADGSADIVVRARAEKIEYAPYWRAVDPRLVITEALAERVALGLEKIEAAFSESEATLTIKAWTPNMAAFRDGHWEVTMPGSASIVQSDDSIVVSMHHLMRQDGSLVTFVNRYLLPVDSFYDNFDMTTAVMSYRLSGQVVEEWREVTYVEPVRVVTVVESAPNAEPAIPESADEFSLEGHWELGKEDRTPLPAGISHIYLDISDESAGKFHGTMVVEHGKLNIPPTILAITESRVNGGDIAFKAETNSKRVGKVSFSFTGKLGRSQLYGAVKFEKRKGDQVVRGSNHEMTFYRPM